LDSIIEAAGEELVGVRAGELGDGVALVTFEAERPP